MGKKGRGNNKGCDAVLGCRRYQQMKMNAETEKTDCKENLQKQSIT